MTSISRCRVAKVPRPRSADSVKLSERSFIRIQDPGSVVGVSSHGSVIALFLNSIDTSFSRNQADKLRNPDVIKIIATENGFHWDRDFSLSGLADIATPYHATPIDFC
jgi:hypothetical protein